MGDSDETTLAAPSSSAASQAQALPAQQNITVTSRQLNITPFAIDHDPLTPPTNGINGRKILNANSVFSAFMTRR